MIFKKGFTNIFLWIVLIVIAVFVIFLIKSFILPLLPLLKFSNLYPLSISGVDSVSFTYTHTDGKEPLFIGDNKFIGFQPSYSDERKCRYFYYYGKRLIFPEPHIDCYESKLLFNNQIRDIKAGETLELNNQISVRYSDKSSIRFEYFDYVDDYRLERPDDFKSVYEFEIKGVSINTRIITPNVLKLNEENTLTLIIDNNLGDFVNDNAGVWIRYKSGLFTRDFKWERIDIDLRKGENVIEIPIKTNELGKFTIEAQAFVLINADSKVMIRERSPVSEKYLVVLDKEYEEMKSYPDENVADDIDESESKIKNFFKDLFDKIKGWFN